MQTDDETFVEEDESESTALAVIGDEPPTEEDAEQSDVRPLESVSVPITGMLTALAAAIHPRPKADGKKDETPEYLFGVRIVAVGSEVRLIGCNGQWVFIYSIPMTAPPQWVRDGVTIPAYLLKERLSLLSKFGSTAAVIVYQTKAPAMELRDKEDLTRAAVTFKIRPMDSDYPDLQPVFDKLELGARTTVDLESVVYHPTYLKGVSSIGAMLGVTDIRVFATGDSVKGAPTLITFPGCPSATLMLMPRLLSEEMRFRPLPSSTVLAGAVDVATGRLMKSLGQWEKKLETGAVGHRSRVNIESKIAGLKARLAVLMPPALPAPMPEPQDAAEEHEQELELHEPDAPIAAAVNPLSFQGRMRAAKDRKQAGDSEEAQREVATIRAKLKGKKRDDAIMRYTADVNAAFSKANNGMTLSQLADGLPIEAWFDGGLSVQTAAVRCLDWRTKGTMLPPDEVEPGEEFERAPFDEHDEAAE